MYRWISGMAIVVAVGILGVVGVGCGGGDETSPTLTKAEFVKQADAICAERKDEWKKAFTSYEKEAEEKDAASNPEVQKEIADEVTQDVLLPSLEQQLESLEGLGAPEGKEKQVEKMLESFSKQMDTIKKPQDLLETGFVDFEEEAKALGVTCPLL